MNKNTMLVVGLVVGAIVGFGIGYMLNQSQITQLQSTLSDTQSDLSASQSEVQSLQGQLADAQTNIISLENQLAAKEADYSTLSAEYNEFKSDMNSVVTSLEKKMELEAQIIKMWVHYERLEITQFSTTALGLGQYVDAVGDSELSTIWDEFLTHFNAGEYTEADARLADLMERNSALIQSDLSELNALLGN